MRTSTACPATLDALSADCYEFGPFHLDLRRRQLQRGEEILALTPKAFDLLQVLVTRADRVVEKDELMKRIWPDSFVGEDSLTQNVAVLRKVLGDASDSPRYIATVHKHGYRFVAPLREIRAADLVERPAAPVTATASPVPSAPLPVPDAASGHTAPRRRTTLRWAGA